MTVAELITELQKYDPTLPVATAYSVNGMIDDDATSVSLGKLNSWEGDYVVIGHD